MNSTLKYFDVVIIHKLLCVYDFSFFKLKYILQNDRIIFISFSACKYIILLSNKWIRWWRML